MNDRSNKDDAAPVPNPLLTSAKAAAAVKDNSDRLKRQAEKARATEVTNAAAAAAAMQRRQPVHHHHQQHQPPGMFGFNHMMGGMMGGGEFPYPGAGMNYFHPGMPTPFVLQPNPASIPPAPSAFKSTAAAAPSAPQVSTAGNRLATVPLPSPINSVNKRKTADDTIVQRLTKKQRPSSTTTQSLLIDLTAQQERKNTGTTKHKSTPTKSTPRDPPGFEAFQRDPSFITSIMASRMKEDGNTDRLLGPLARGIINMSDEEIFKLSNDENDATMKTFVTDVIMPLLGIDDNIAQSNYLNWQGYAHISSENLRSVAKNFFYVRRSSMKAAVQVAFYEMKKNHQKILQAGGYNRSNNSVPSDESTAIKVQQLERALKKQKEDNAKMTKQIEEIYESDIADMRNDHKLHVEELKEAHKKEVKALKEEMEDMKSSHREFLGHYVEAAAEAVRFAQKQGEPSSLVIDH
eukprot:scaffold17899_cov113-Skeletonema_dohrnii-CCMP3373.AAC.1